MSTFLRRKARMSAWLFHQPRAPMETLKCTFPAAAAPVQPGSPGPDTKVEAPSFELSKANEVSRADYNNGKAALYPTGLAVTADGATLVTPNNLGDSVTIVRALNGARQMERVDLH